MFYNLKIAFRSLRRNSVYSVINIGGLAIGITASILIFLWVYNERSYDKFRADADRIYRINYTIKVGDNDSWIWAWTPYPLTVACKNIPGIEGVAVMNASKGIQTIKVNNELFSIAEDAVYADKSWLEMLDYKIVDGSLTAFGNNPFSVALTESEAKKYFGNAQAIGQTVRIQNNDYMIQAVIKDNPPNSTIRKDVFISTDALFKDSVELADSKNWSYCNWTTFVKLSPGADVEQISKKINDLIPPDDEVKTQASLRRSTDIHFETDINNSLFIHGNSKTVSIFTLLGLLLLFTACINYVNLTTAKANLRAKEVGMRKIIGAKRKTLFLQFITESLLVSLFSVLISLLLLWMLAPLYHLLVENASFSFSSPVLWSILGIVLLTTTLLNGIYPALMLSSFNPLNSLKGLSMLNMKNSSLRKGLVVFQFTLSTALIISVLVIYKQMHYVQNMNPGYNREQIFTIKTPYSLYDSNWEKAASTMQTIKQKLQQNTDIKGVSLSSGESISNIGSSIGTKGNAEWDGRTEGYASSANFTNVDGDFCQLFGLKMTEGRWFEGERKSDENNVILNETAVRELKIPQPVIGRRFKCMRREGQIIGVVKDFHFKSLHEKIAPLIIINHDATTINIKAEAGKTGQVIQAAQKIYSEFFPDDPFEYTFLDDSFNNLYKADIQASQLMLAFSILTILIALLGLFGLSTFAIERRTKEIGIRKILGASVSAIIKLVTKEFLILVAIAFVIAAPVSWWAMNKWLESFAYRVNITAWIFIAGAALTVIIAFIAMGWQAIKAATANPVKAISNSE